jgi:hypothetical protein
MKRQLAILEKNSGLGVRKRGIARASWATRQLHEASAVVRLSLSPASGPLRRASSMGAGCVVFLFVRAMPLSRDGAVLVLVLVLVLLVLSGRIHSHSHSHTYPDATSGRCAVRLRRMEHVLMTCLVAMDDYDAATV